MIMDKRFAVTFRKNPEIQGLLQALERYYLDAKLSSIVIEALKANETFDVAAIASPNYVPLSRISTDKAMVYVDLKNQENYEKFLSLKLAHKCTTPYLVKILLRWSLKQQLTTHLPHQRNHSDMALIKAIADLFLDPSQENTLKLSQIREVLYPDTKPPVEP